MIDPKLLTEEAGFVEGVVVEIVWEDEDHKPWPTHWPIFALSGLNPVKSIRPLTGPMAIWNFAPEWAVCCQSREMGISWEHKIPEWWDGKSSVLQLRPWWAK